MSAANRLHGKSGLVQMDAAGGSSLVTLADMNGWTLNATKDKQDATAFGDTNKVKVVGLPDYSGNLNARYARDSTPTLFSALLGATAVTLRLIPDSNQLAYYYQGLAYIDGSINVSHDGVVNFSGSWDAAASWTQAP